MRMGGVAAAIGALTCTSAVLTWLDPHHFRSLAFIVPDSASYLEWNIARTPLYPLVLSAVHAITPGLSLLGPLQFTLFAAAVTLLAREALHLWNGSAAAVVGASLMLNPQLVSYTFTV